MISDEPNVFEMGSSGWGQTLSRALAAALTILLTGPFVVEWMGRQRTASAASQVENEIERLIRANISAEDEQYTELKEAHEAIRASAEPVPTWLYKKMRNNLNAEWISRKRTPLP